MESILRRGVLGPVYRATACAAYLAAGLLTSNMPATAQGCDAMPPASDFKAEKIADAPGWPLDIVVGKDLRVFWIERYGDFKVWDPSTRQTTLLKHLDVLVKDYAGFTDVENGLEGMALDADFADTHWVFLWYTPAVAKGAYAKGSLGPVVRLSRFTLRNNDREVDPASERPIFEHKIFAQCCHFGGSMRMSRDGLLYWSTGDNIDYHYTGTGEARAFDSTLIQGDPRNTSSNTDDTRGKILRIRPIPFPDAEKPPIGIGSTYAIPPGNLRDTWASAEKEKVRPEIFSMGHRNPYSIALHPDKPWVAVGEANGDNPDEGDDEISVMTGPANLGWPYLIGDNKIYLPGFWTGRGDAAKDPAAYRNESKWNTGAKALPPATGSIVSGRHGAMNMPLNCFGVTWGFVAYDPMLASKSKWPPYLKDKLLVSSYGAADVRAASLDGNGRITKLERFFPAAEYTTDILRTVQGPDGAFYVSRGDAGSFDPSDVCRIYKISYTGACSTVGLAAGPLPGSFPARTIRAANLGNLSVTLPPGTRRLKAYDPRGTLAWEARAAGPAGQDRRLRAPDALPRGMLEIRFFPE